jgi:hypothetical protein
MLEQLRVALGLSGDARPGRAATVPVGFEAAAISD